MSAGADEFIAGSPRGPLGNKSNGRRVMGLANTNSTLAIIAYNTCQSLAPDGEKSASADCIFIFERCVLGPAGLEVADAIPVDP